MLVTFLVFHFEIFGSDFNEEHSENIWLIFLELIVFQFEIAGNIDNDEHPENI